MTRADINRRARTIIVRELICNPHRVTDVAEFVRDLGANDQDMADVKAAIEAEFGIRITLREIAFAETFGTACDLIETKLENRRAA